MQRDGYSVRHPCTCCCIGEGRPPARRLHVVSHALQAAVVSLELGGLLEEEEAYRYFPSFFFSSIGVRIVVVHRPVLSCCSSILLLLLLLLHAWTHEGSNAWMLQVVDASSYIRKEVCTS